MSATNLGRVSIVPKGSYDVQTNYTRQDLVTYQGNTYLAVADSTGADQSDTTKWMLIVDTQSQNEAIASLAQFVNFNDIKTFTASPSSVEIGNASASVALAWTFNATPTSLTLNGVSKSITSTGETVTAIDDDVTHQVTYTLATSVGSKTVTFHFYPNLYWGVSSVASNPTSELVTGLANKQLSGTKAKTFTVNAGAGEYIYYCCPVRSPYGAATFKVNGFDGGFEDGQIVSVVNNSNYAENYYVYRSTNPNLGETTVVVS